MKSAASHDPRFIETLSELLQRKGFTGFNAGETLYKGYGCALRTEKNGIVVAIGITPYSMKATYQFADVVKPGPEFDLPKKDADYCDIYQPIRIMLKNVAFDDDELDNDVEVVFVREQA
jgi:hypothetical protein